MINIFKKHEIYKRKFCTQCQRAFSFRGRPSNKRFCPYPAVGSVPRPPLYARAILRSRWPPSFPAWICHVLCMSKNCNFLPRLHFLARHAAGVWHVQIIVHCPMEQMEFRWTQKLGCQRASIRFRRQWNALSQNKSMVV